MTILSYHGTVQLYFGWHHANGLVWCVNIDGHEIDVASITMRNVSFTSRYVPENRRPPGDHNGPPTAYFEASDTSVDIDEQGNAVVYASI